MKFKTPPHIINCDEFGPRIIEVNTKKQTFETPNRAINSTESNYKKEVIGAFARLDDSLDSLSLCYENPVFEVVRNYERSDRKDNLRDMLTKNGPFNEEIKRNLKPKLSGYEDKICLFYPRLNKGVKLTFDDIKTLIDLQRESGFDFITVPDLYPSTRANEFEKLCNSARNRIESFDFEIIPYIDIEMDHALFKQKISAVIDNGFNMLGLTARAIRPNYANYRYIETISKNKDIWIHASNITRCIDYGRKHVSQPHVLSIYGIDTYALESRAAGVGCSFSLDLHYVQHLKVDKVNNELIEAFKNNNCFLSNNANIITINEKKWEIKDGIKKYKIKFDDKKLNIYGDIKPQPPENVKMFDINSLGVISKRELQERYGNKINCDCPICQGKDLDGFYKDYFVDPKGKNEELKYLRYHAYIHEVFASYSEFKKERLSIKENDSKNYFDGKEFFKKIKGTLKKEDKILLSF